jgi:hypothetical protein
LWRNVLFLRSFRLYPIILLGSLLGLVVPVIHMMGRGVGVAGSIGHTRGAFFFVWTLIAIGVTSLLSVVLSVRGLWGLRRRLVLPKPAAVLVPPFRSCKPAASDGGTRCRSWGFVQADED